MHKTPLGPRRRSARALLRWQTIASAFSAVLLVSGATAAVAAAVQAAPAASTALTANWYESAPYYSTLDSTAPNVGQVMSATGQKAFDMAFILANGGSCSPSWDASDRCPPTLRWPPSSARSARPAAT